jgi:hypothetical protein
MNMQALEPLVGDWRVEISHPSQDAPIGGATSFAWLEGGGYLIQRSVTDDPRFPKGIMVIGPTAAGDRIVQHYFDSRGVARIFDISLEDGVLRLWRDDEDFAQRYAGRFSDDATTMTGAFEICRDGTAWVRDFDITYAKVSGA